MSGALAVFHVASLGLPNSMALLGFLSADASKRQHSKMMNPKVPVVCKTSAYTMLSSLLLAKANHTPKARVTEGERGWY